jgi:hypothetical protein
VAVVVPVDVLSAWPEVAEFHGWAVEHLPRAVAVHGGKVWMVSTPAGNAKCHRPYHENAEAAWECWRERYVTRRRRYYRTLADLVDEAANE